MIKNRDHNPTQYEPRGGETRQSARSFMVNHARASVKGFGCR